MSWREISLGDAFRIKHGFAFKSKFFSDQGEYIVLTPGNFFEQGGFRSRPGKDRYYEGDIPQDFILEDGQIIVAMTEQGPGLLGSAAIIPNGAKYLHNQRLGLVQRLDESILNHNFLFYLLNTRPIRAQISASASGTKVRHTAPERIYRVRARVPGNPTVQKRIADVLAAYDELIENNRRRIQLLEQAARLLYKEWFVHLRFPGHEHVPITNGVPDGWEEKPLGDLLTLQRGFDLPVKKRKVGAVPIFASTGINGHHNVSRVRGPGVVTGRSGSLGKVMYAPRDFWPLNTTLWVKEFKRVGPLYSYYLLSMMGLQQYNGGAAVPTLNRNDVHRIRSLLPPNKLLAMFDKTADTIFVQIDTLERSIQRLARARDLLLPRLMNGEITV